MSVPNPVQSQPPAIAPYHPPPSYPPPSDSAARGLDNRAVIALAIAGVGLVLGLPLGIPGLICGSIAYFLGKSAVTRIQASAGSLSGHNVAKVAWIIGIIDTAVGALVSLVWLVLYLSSVSGTPPA